MKFIKKAIHSSSSRSTNRKRDQGIPFARISFRAPDFEEKTDEVTGEITKNKILGTQKIMAISLPFAAETIAGLEERVCAGLEEDHLEIMSASLAPAGSHSFALRNQQGEGADARVYRFLELRLANLGGKFITPPGLQYGFQCHDVRHYPTAQKIQQGVIKIYFPAGVKFQFDADVLDMKKKN